MNTNHNNSHREDKHPVQFYLNHEDSKKLKELSILTGKSKSQFIRDEIINQYNKHIGSNS